MKVPIVENVLKINDEMAAMNRRTLQDACVFTIDVIGAPGCGKTALIEATLAACRDDPTRFGVIVGDLATDRDATRLARQCQHVVQINTGKGCHLDANQVRQAVAQIELDAIDVLFIENVGNLICPVGFDLGQDVKVGVFCVAEGDDKAAKHPYLVQEADLLLLNKIDLLPHVPFDLEKLQADVERLNPGVDLLQVSVSDSGLEKWLPWLRDRIAAAISNRASIAQA